MIDFGTYFVQRRAQGATPAQITNEYTIYKSGLAQQQQQQDARDLINSFNDRTAALEGQIAQSTAANQETINRITTGFQSQLDATNTGYQSLIDKLTGMQVSYQDQIGKTVTGIEGMIEQQQQSFQEQLARSANLARASVPMPAPSAMAPTVGRLRRNVVGENASNMLANLQIFNRSATSNPLAGLQIT